jgi:uncharacterized protein (DUF58 family)
MRFRFSQHEHTASGGRSGWIDPAALMRIQSLELRAKVVVEGFLHGLHRSPYHGFSAEFSEYRQYSPGDEPRYLDWKLYARSDRYYIKRFEDETNLRCYLLLDTSRSMKYGSLEFDKSQYARTVVATLAYFLSLQRDAVGLVTFDERIGEYLPARFRPGHLHRLMMALEHAPTGTSTNLQLPIEQIAATVHKRGLVVLVSDLLTPLELLEQHLGYLRFRGHDVMLLRVLDPAERDLAFDDASMIRDLETGRMLYIDPAVARSTYKQRFETHAATLRQICARLGIDHSVMFTDQPLESSLFDVLHARLGRGRKMVRRASPIAGGGPS